VGWWRRCSRRTRTIAVVGAACVVMGVVGLAVILGADSGWGGPSSEITFSVPTVADPGSSANTPSATSSLPGSGASHNSTTAATIPPSAARREVDVVVYGSTTSGLGVIRGLKMALARHPGRLTVALVSVAEALESPLVQGLCIEDDYDPGSITGFYQEFRTEVARYYEAMGVWPHERNGRLTYEPVVAQSVLESLVFNDAMLPERVRGRVDLVRVQGVLTEAADVDGDRHVVVTRPDGSRLRLDARYLVDASVEADLARMVGCRYMMGRSADVFDDVRGPRPPKPTRADLYAVSPQSLGCLVTLVSVPGGARPIEERDDWLAAQAAQGERWKMPEAVLAGFPQSWSMRHSLPNGRHELNELWSDWADPDIIVRWYLEPWQRQGLVRDMQQRILVLLAQVQERYPEIGIDRLPTWPYVRGEVMILGDHLYSTSELRGELDEIIATGKYAVFDRHDPVHGSLQPDEAAVVCLPMDATRPQGHPNLLVSTAYSVDYKAYSSALRMEPTRAAVGVACGAQVALAATRGVAIHDIVYAELRGELLAQGQSPER